MVGLLVDGGTGPGTVPLVPAAEADEGQRRRGGSGRSQGVGGLAGGLVGRALRPRGGNS